MHILVLSDLHLELGHAYVAPQGIDYDVVVLAGDIHAPGTKGVEWAQRQETFSGRPVILVPGNHEFYGSEMGKELARMTEAAGGSNVHVLARDTVVIDGVRFIGCILWTDFDLPVRGSRDDATTSDVERALGAARDAMNDYRRIRIDDSRAAQEMPTWDGGGRLLTPEDTLVMHRRDRAWLQQELAKPFDGPTVVVTHHAPAAGSVAKRYASDWATPAFVSALPEEFFAGVDVWVHGHTHTAFDYQVGTCRVVSNPRGYILKDGSFENHKFAKTFTAEVLQRPHD